MLKVSVSRSPLLGGTPRPQPLLPQWALPSELPAPCPWAWGHSTHLLPDCLFSLKDGALRGKAPSCLGHCCIPASGQRMPPIRGVSWRRVKWMNLPGTQRNTSFFAQTLNKAPTRQPHLLCPSISYPQEQQEFQKAALLSRSFFTNKRRCRSFGKPYISNLLGC